MLKVLLFISALAVPALSAIAAPPTPDMSPVSPTDSLRYFQLPDDLTIELAAAEPEVVDPIDVRFDEFGRMYVVEMSDYPLGPKPGQPPLSRIKLLEDRDGDGRYETSFVFADKLLFATGVQPWRGGVIVTLAGRVAYLKDTDGDHRADVDETWFTGFAEENAQLRANHPRFAHDNHIYIANGLRGGKIVDVRPVGVPPSGGPEPPKGGTPTDISGRDFRFDPRGTLAEAVSGVGQYGLCFDDFGHRFVCQNRNPLQHVVFEERDLKKSKHYTPPAVMNDVAAFAEKSKLFPLTKTWTTSNLHENTFTAACGVNIYRGNALPEKYRGLAFTCDPTGNLVHAEKMEPWGPTFRSKPLYEDREFLASTDEWFRPVAIENGPDGALYVVDMYRAVIEHPDWVPDELKRRPDERYGDDRGRIYRIVAKGKRPARFDLPGKASAKELVQLLAHENAWQRETAQRLLIERGEKDLLEELVELLKHERRETVFHALWTLAGLRALEVDHLKLIAARSERILISSVARMFDSTAQKDEELRKLIIEGPTVHSRYRIAGIFAPLAPLNARESSSRAAHATTASEDDPWSRYEVLMTAPVPVSNTLQGAFDLVDERSAGTPGPGLMSQMESFARELGRLAGFLDDAETLDGLLADMDEWWVIDGNVEFVQNATLGLAEGLAKRGKRLSDVAKRDPAKRLMTRATKSALAEATDTDRVEEHLLVRYRLPAIEFLRHQESLACQKALADLMRDPVQSVRIAAIKAVLATPTQDTGMELLSRVRSESPTVKRAILDGLISRPATLTLLLDALDKSQLQTTDIDPALVPRIVNVGDPALKARAQKLFAPPPDADRQKTLETYSASLKLAVDAKSGRVHFEKHCATCHKVGELGVNVAPDISDSRTKTPQQILLDILQPNRAVDGNYVAYVVSTNDGKVLTGVISAETSQAITLKQPGGQLVVVPRSEIEELTSTGKSLMPEGLERTIPPEQMAEVVAYIKNWRYLDGKVPARP